MEESEKKQEISFERLSKDWLLYKKQQIKESTYMNYKFKVDKYIRPYYKGKRLSYFKKYDYSDFKDYLINKKNFEPKTIKDILFVLKGMLLYAERRYDVRLHLDLLSIPKIRRKDTKIISNKDCKKLKRICKNSDDLRVLGIFICLYTGVRIGELCGLMWDDIDLVKKTITIRRTVQRIYAGKGQSRVNFDLPKTDKSFREIPLCTVLYEKLKDIKPLYNSRSFVLTGKEFKFIEPRNFQYFFKIFLKKKRISHYNFHLIRHKFATDCIAVGMDVKSLSEILGHADVSVTLNRYVHSAPKIKKKYMERL